MIPATAAETAAAVAALPAEPVAAPPPMPISARMPDVPRRGVALLGVGIGLVLVALAGIRFVLPAISATAALATATPTNVAVAVVPSTTPTVPPPTANPTPEPTLGPVVDPSLDIDPTPEPTPAVTAAPTPSPTPTPTPTQPAATPTPTPKPTPATATLVVYLNVLTDNGGTRKASEWTVKANSSGASPSSFPGSAAGIAVHLVAGRTYNISASGPTGYAQSRSGDCSGSLAAGATANCTVLENDRPVSLAVNTVISGGSATPGQATITVTANSSQSAPGSATNYFYFFDSHHGYSTTGSDLAGYTVSYSGSCSDASGYPEGTLVNCTVTYTSTGAGAIGGPWAWIVLPLGLRRRSSRRRS